MATETINRAKLKEHGDKMVSVGSKAYAEQFPQSAIDANLEKAGIINGIRHVKIAKGELKEFELKTVNDYRRDGYEITENDWEYVATIPDSVYQERERIRQDSDYARFATDKSNAGFTTTVREDPREVVSTRDLI